jgi:Uncharacterised nucleotidyltransferase
MDARDVAVFDLRTRHWYRTNELELTRVSAVAQSVGVEIGVVKGVVNAERWFASDPAVRQCADVDLFLNPSDAAGAERLISALQPDHPLAGHAEALMRSGVLPDVPIDNGRVLVEIHANPMTLRLHPDRMIAGWQSTVPVTTRGGATVRALDPTMGLIHALINSAKDNHAFLLQVIEIGRAIGDPAVDWARFEQVCRDLRWDTVIGDSIDYVCSVLAVKRPSITLKPDNASKQVLRRIAPAHDRLGGLDSWRRAQRFCKLDLAVPGGRLRTVAGIAGRTLSPDEYIRAFAPDLTGPYLTRAVRFWIRRQQYVKGRRTSLSGPIDPEPEFIGAQTMKETPVHPENDT